MKNLLEEFSKEFTSATGVIHTTLEERTYPHWKRLVIREPLNCEKLERIAKFISYKFSQPGKYSHLLVRLGMYDGKMCITADVEDLERIYK